MSASVAGLSVEALSKTLQSGDRKFQLDVPVFYIAPGEIVGLIGRSGSGKSTFLDLIAMVSKPDQVGRMVLETDAGQVDLKDLILKGSDRDISRMRANHLGYVLQHGGLLGYLTARKNIELPFRLSNRPFRPDLIDALAAQVGIENELDKYPASLSGGQRQRVSVLRAIAARPSLILCDEPTASVDEHSARRILDELTEIARQSGSAILIVSHDLDLVSAFTDRTYIASAFEEGSLVRSLIREAKR